MKAIKPRGPWRRDNENEQNRNEDGWLYDNPIDDRVMSESDNKVFQTETSTRIQEMEMNTSPSRVSPVPFV